MMSPHFLMDRNEFLEARSKSFAEALEKKDEFMIVIPPPDDEILCDDCSEEILDRVIHLVNRGSRVACPECYDNWLGGQ